MQLCPNCNENKVPSVTVKSENKNYELKDKPSNLCGLYQAYSSHFHPIIHHRLLALHHHHPACRLLSVTKQL